MSQYSTSHTATTDNQAAPEPTSHTSTTTPTHHKAWTGGGVIVVFGLAICVSILVSRVPEWAEGTWFGPLSKSIEFPIYAIILGFAANATLSLLGWSEKMSAAFRTELFIKTGLVLLGSTVNLGVIVTATAPAVLQAIALIATVFLLTWWFAGLLGVDNHLRALLASALSICGVSAAVAAAGAVHAKKEQLAYTAGLVTVFAVPSIFLLPWLAELMGLSAPVAGAWIGGNIDTTAAVTAAGAVAGDDVLEYAAIVKMTQNALIGFVAVALSLYFTMKVDRSAATVKPHWGEVWTRFPKFVLGFIAASIFITILAAIFPAAASGGWLDAGLDAAKSLQTFLFTLAFVSIGLEFRFESLRQAGWKPIVVFAFGTTVNLIVGLFLAWLFFGVIFAGMLG
ncbi:YeiH family protein [Corynebacterium cystitidis]|uniref:YeiH family protein n=1 Tax=Corynebacterium cystitidis TaxID=35757 RepID=UPI00211EBC12|nr:putative sulfate exporter family transporter [Corynebacterium cystitidis]